MECEFPTINSNKEEMKEIFENTKSIALIGCSPDVTKASNKVANYLIIYCISCISKRRYYFRSKSI